MKSLDQIRAKAAYTFLSANNNNDALLNLCAALPMMLRRNGWLATMAHYCGQSKVEYKKLVTWLFQQFQYRGLPLPIGQHWVDQPDIKRYESIHNVYENSPQCLLLATKEALYLAEWLKRAADAYDKG